MRSLCSIHGYYLKPTKNTRCPKCNKEYDTKTRDKNSKKIYNSAKWKAVRAEVLVRDAARCVQCDSKENLVVDHIEELKDGGDAYALNNLETLCKACHSIKTHEEKRKRNAN